MKILTRVGIFCFNYIVLILKNSGKILNGKFVLFFSFAFHEILNLIKIIIIIKMSVYKDSNNYLMLKSFCAYLDILGFKEKIEINDTSYFATYLHTLNNELKNIDDKYDYFDETKRRFEIKIFTDNFVFGQPWNDEIGEIELSYIFDILSMMQLNFIKSDVFLRGAISISDLFMNDNVVLGPALIEAYNLESKSAIYPRIIISDGVNAVINKHFSYYAEPTSAPQNKILLKDIDGKIFLNYLYCLFFDNGFTQIQIISELKSHRQIIQNNLQKYIDNYKVFDKYAWSANYHNYFCNTFLVNEFPGINLQALLIPENEFKKQILKLL
ncbi:hypothetical protein [Chryseobacterium hispalense]|uniref:hypothetical protein n=1 Tax=Chryseobacterium hispalense TaxID=1453492 RepID=UPI0006904EFE|nr:hypothetical protein [Chryseobacterium hispalense]